MRNNGRKCLPSLRNTVDSMETVSFQKTTKRTLHLEYGSITQRQDVMSLILNEFARLESIGFVWDAFDQQWEEMFAKLEEYRRENGDCLVPYCYKEDPSLGIWVVKHAS